jgi:predicted nucleic acid-binding protein
MGNEMRALLDTNVLLDWLLDREPWKADANRIAQQIGEDKLICIVAATTVTNLFYVARRLIGQDKAMALVAKCLNLLEVWPVDHPALSAALQMTGSDFEDNVQIAVAQVAADCIVTRDETGFRHSPIRVFSPHDFLALLSAK